MQSTEASASGRRNPTRLQNPTPPARNGERVRPRRQSLSRPKQQHPTPTRTPRTPHRPSRQGNRAKPPQTTKNKREYYYPCGGRWGGPAHGQRKKLTAASKAKEKSKGSRSELVLPLLFSGDLLRGYLAGGNSDPVSAQASAGFAGYETLPA